jgi:hypothetical protein
VHHHSRAAAERKFDNAHRRMIVPQPAQDCNFLRHIVTLRCVARFRGASMLARIAQNIHHRAPIRCCGELTEETMSPQPKIEHSRRVGRQGET